MIESFTKVWFSHKQTLEEQFSKKHPEDYKEIVEAVVRLLSDNLKEFIVPDPTRIHEIDDGDYQGCLVYVIAAKGYQPFTYWYVRVDYGSCSGCDTLQGITNYSRGIPTKEQVNGYMTLALHILQGLKEM